MVCESFELELVPQQGTGEGLPVDTLMTMSGAVVLGDIEWEDDRLPASEVSNGSDNVRNSP